MLTNIINSLKYYFGINIKFYKELRFSPMQLEQSAGIYNMNSVGGESYININENNY